MFRRFLKGLDRLIVILVSWVLTESANQGLLLRRKGMALSEGICVIGLGRISGIDLNPS
jgi:hypothetical protein